MEDTFQQFKMEIDDSKKKIALSKDATKFELGYAQPDGDHLVLEGKLMDDVLSVRLRKIDTTKFLLVKRGFHWINEVPFNR